MRASSLWILLVAGVSGCILWTPTDHGDRFLRILVERSEYPADQTGSILIRAVVINRTTDREFYSDVGDRVGPLDQSMIFATRWAQAVIERQTASGAWEIASQGSLTEGTRFVALRTGKRYDLEGTIAPKAGRYRIRIAYSVRNEDRTPPFRDYSAAFVVR